VAGRSGGRRLLSLEGGNRGVVADDAVLLSCYGDCMLALGWLRLAFSLIAIRTECRHRLLIKVDGLLNAKICRFLLSLALGFRALG
jgi:hypothetical protein